MRLEEKHVLITGAANGIGKEIAKLFFSAGANVIAWDIDKIGLEMLRKELPGINTHHVDICNETQVVYTLRERVKDVDILINNAGIGHNGGLDEMNTYYMGKLINVNFKAPVNLVDECLPYLKKNKGHIVNVSSGQAFFKLPTWAAYAAIKSALSTWSELLSIELAKHDITVTTVYPFMVDTGFYAGVEEKSETWAGKMSMKLLPWYSNKPETVAKKIFNAVKRRKRVEMVHPANWIGYHLDTVPSVGHAIRWVANKFLGK